MLAEAKNEKSDELKILLLNLLGCKSVEIGCIIPTKFSASVTNNFDIIWEQPGK